MIKWISFNNVEKMLEARQQISGAEKLRPPAPMPTEKTFYS